MSAKPDVTRVRQLRRDATEAEKLLWRKLRELEHPAAHFRQQTPIGPYIADFASHRLRLVIEVDGGQHGRLRKADRDSSRDRWLRSQGYRVLRFWNNDVLDNPEGVMSEIIATLEDAPPTPDPSPPGGGEMGAQVETANEPSPLMGEGLGGGDSRRRSDPDA